MLVDRPGAPQTVIRLIGPGLARRSPLRPPLSLCTTVLGGSFLSRLNANLREEKGYTYGAGGGFRFGREAGSFDAGSDVFTNVTGPALSELLKEIARIHKEAISDDELRKARAIALARLAGTLATTGGLASIYGDMFVHEEPLDAPERLMKALAKQTPQTVLAATSKTLDPEALAVVVVGDRAKVEAAIKAAGLPAPELRDTEGEIVTAP